MKFTHTMEIRGPLKDVFALITDIDNGRYWMNGLVAIQRDEKGPFKLGSTWTEVRKMYGKEASEVFEVTEFTPEKSFTLYVDGSKGTTGKGAYIFHHRFREVQGRTHLTMEGEIKMPGLIAAILMRFLGGMFRKAIIKDNEAMAAWLEEKLQGKG
jgi:carbon monoxide dehydrogenase subunit G